MQPYIVELPLRTIHLELQDKEQTELDTCGLAAYISLHKELWELKQFIEQLRKEVEKAAAIAKDIKAAYDDMEDETKKYGRFAGFPDDYPFFPENEKITLKIKHLQNRIDTYAKLVDRYNERRDYYDTIFNDAEKKREGYYESFSQFDHNYFTPMINAWAEVQVDMSSLDLDFDNFREVSTEVDELYDSIIDEWNAMCESIKEVDQKIKQLNPHINCVSDMIAASKLSSENPELN